LFAYSVSMPPNLRPIYTRDYVNQLRRLTPEVMAIVEALVDRLLLEQGMSLTSGNWLKPLGDGLWEFRIGQSFKSALRAAGLRIYRVLDLGEFLLGSSLPLIKTLLFYWAVTTS